MPAAILSIIFSGSFTKEESQRTAAQDAMECSAHHFAQVFNDYRQPFIHFAYTYTRNATVAEDIVMDAVLSFWELRESLPQETDIPAYLFGTIRNKSIDHLRKELRKRKAAGVLSEQAEWEMKQRITFLDESGQSLFTKEIRTIAEDQERCQSMRTATPYWAKGAAIKSNTGGVINQNPGYPSTTPYKEPLFVEVESRM